MVVAEEVEVELLERALREEMAQLGAAELADLELVREEQVVLAEPVA